jgi:hypothetical protein
VHAERATSRGTGRTTGRFGGAGWYGGRLGSFGGSFSAVTEAHGEQSTALSQILAPPSEPLYVNRWGLVSIALLVLGLLAGLLALLTVPDLRCMYDSPTTPTRTVCWQGQESVLLEMPVSVRPNPEVLTRVVDGGLIALPIGLLAGLVMLRMLVGVRRRRRYCEAHKVWQREYGHWCRLFYCRRCDGVFEPGMRQSLIHAADLPEMLP